MLSADSVALSGPLIVVRSCNELNYVNIRKVFSVLHHTTSVHLKLAFLFSSPYIIEASRCL